eukprot:1144219-Pelagomonas_calceolata.AAC.1
MPGPHSVNTFICSVSTAQRAYAQLRECMQLRECIKRVHVHKGEIPCASGESAQSALSYRPLCIPEYRYACCPECTYGIKSGTCALTPEHSNSFVYSPEPALAWIVGHLSFLVFFVCHIRATKISNSLRVADAQRPIQIHNAYATQQMLL